MHFARHIYVLRDKSSALNLSYVRVNVRTFHLMSFSMIDFPSGQKMAAEPNIAPMFVANRYKALDYVFEVIYVYLLCMLCHTHFNLFNLQHVLFYFFSCLDSETVSFFL